jgi:hypothetical protein
MNSDAGSAPDPAALDRVRRDLADLGRDAESAPEVPPEVITRVVHALRNQPGHTLSRPRLSVLQRAGLLIGAVATVIGAVVGVAMLARDPVHSYSPGPTAQEITTTRIPLSDGELADLSARPPDYGPLADVERRNACLSGLGYPPGTPVLGARRLTMHGQAVVLLLLPGTDPDAVVAVVVEAGCSAAHTGLLADTTITRP